MNDSTLTSDLYGWIFFLTLQKEIHVALRKDNHIKIKLQDLQSTLKWFYYVLKSKMNAYSDNLI